MNPYVTYRKGSHLSFENNFKKIEIVHIQQQIYFTNINRVKNR